MEGETNKDKDSERDKQVEGMYKLHEYTRVRHEPVTEQQSHQSRLLQNWLIGFGVGALVLVLGDSPLFKNLDPPDRTFVLVFAMIGLACQVIVVGGDKYALRYIAERNAENEQVIYYTILQYAATHDFMDFIKNITSRAESVKDTTRVRRLAFWWYRNRWIEVLGDVATVGAYTILILRLYRVLDAPMPV